MELAGEQTLYRIFLSRELFQRFERNFLQIQLADPLIFRTELPIGQLQLAVDAGFHRAATRAATGDDQFAGRIGHFPVERVESEIIVAGMLTVKMALERRAVRWTDDSAIPLERTVNDDFRVWRARLVSGKRVNEIIPWAKRADIHVDIEGCVFRMENSREAAARGGGVKIKLAELQRVRSIAVAKDGLAGNGNVARHGFVGLIPTHARGNIEVAEIVVPGFDRVGKNHGVPVEAVDGEARVIDGGRDRAKANALDSGFTAEFQAVVFHCDAAFDAAAESIRPEVRQNNSIGFEQVAGAAGEIGGVKVFEAQNDVIRGELAFSLERSGRERAIAAQINSSERHFRGSKGFANIQEVEPCAITIAPVGRFEIFGLGLQVEVGAPHIHDSLFHGKGIAAGGEFC